MMTLNGWDTASVTDVALVNASLAARQNELITEFDFREKKLHFKGRFGAWEILPGGSLQLLNIRIPIKNGWMNGLPGRRGRTNVADTALILKIALRLLPAPDGSGKTDLLFDFTPKLAAGPDDPVLPIDVEDPKGRLDEFQSQMLRVAAAACLSAHGGDVNYVFASVQTRGTTTTELLATPYTDWCNVVTADGRQYLAVMGALSPPTAKIDRFDPNLIAKPGSAYLAISNRMFLERLLHPALEKDFRPRAKFKLAGSQIRNTAKIHLPTQHHGAITLNPVIDRIQFQPVANALSCKVSTKTDIPLGAVLSCNLDMTMPFQFDPKNRHVSFAPDKHPKESHTANLPGVLDVLIGWLVRFIVSFFDEPIRQIATSTAHSMQSMSSKKVSTANWTGVRDFQVGGTRFDGCLWFCDTRPVGAEQKKADQMSLAQ